MEASKAVFWKRGSNGVVVITPSLAAAIISCTKKAGILNRNLQPLTITRYGNDMTSGVWETNGEPIQLTEGGACWNGQHRLAACVATGVTFSSNVWVGKPTICDAGRKRTLSDWLKLNGEINCAQLAATIRMHWRLAEFGRPNIQSDPTIHQASAHLEAHPMIRESVSRAVSCGGLVPASALAYIHYEARNSELASVDDFLLGLRTGDSLGLGDPRLLLRNRLISDKMSKAKLPPTEKLALTIKAWNAFATNRELKILRWRAYGDAAEAFPTPVTS